VSEKKVSVFFLILTRKNNVGRLQKEAWTKGDFNGDGLGS
jgi:hypothetical protein